MVANPHSPEWSGERPCKTAPTSSSMTSARGISGAGNASSQRFLFSVDHDALRQRAQIGVLAGDDDGAEMLMQRPLHASAGRGSCAHAIGPPVLERLLLIGGCGFPQLLARRAVLLRVAPAPAFSDPAAELVGIEAAVAAVGQGGKGAVLEREEGRIRALRRSRRVPRSGQRAHGCGAAAREQPHDVDLMRSLAEYDAAALLRVELLAAPRPVEKVSVVAGVDHAHGAKPAASHQFRRAQVRGVEAVAVPDEELDVRPSGRSDHRPAILDGQRHRLLDQHMLAGGRGQRRVRCMELVRRRDIDRIDFSVRAQFLHRCKGARGKLLGKSPARLRARIGRGDQRHALILPEDRAASA